MYALERDHDTLVYQSKPFSLFHQDVPLPPDEWKPIGHDDRDLGTLFFNPLRGTTSAFNTSTVSSSHFVCFMRRFDHSIH